MMMRVPLPGSLSTPSVPVEVHHQPPHDGEPQAGAALLRRVEVVEDPAGLVARHAAAGVGDGHADRRQLAVSLDDLRRDRDAARLRLQAVHRVGDEVLEDTPEGDRIADDAREIRRQVASRPRRARALRRAHDVGDQRVQIAVAPLRAAATAAGSSWPASRDTRCWNRPSGAARRTPTAARPGRRARPATDGASRCEAG